YARTHVCSFRRPLVTYSPSPGLSPMEKSLESSGPVVKDVSPLESFMTVAISVEVRFQRWDEVLKMPQPAATMKKSTAYCHLPAVIFSLLPRHFQSCIRPLQCRLRVLVAFRPGLLQLGLGFFLGRFSARGIDLFRFLRRLCQDRDFVRQDLG